MVLQSITIIYVIILEWTDRKIDVLALNDGIKVWIECLLRYTEHWPIVYIPYIVKVSGCLFFRVV